MTPKLRRIHFFEILLVAFGVILGVFFSQIKYFEIDEKISLSDLSIFVLTSLVAIYIADTISKSLSRIQSIKTLFQDDIKNIISYSVKLEEWTELGSIPLSDVVKHMKTGNMKLRSLNKIYSSRKNEIKTPNLNAIINSYNNLKQDITNLPNLQNGILILSPAEVLNFQSRIEDIKCELLNAIIEA